MIPMIPGTKVYLACQPVSMRLGFDGLAARVAEMLAGDPFSGHLFLFRSKRADYLKVLYYDGTGLCLFAKRLESGRFVWPPPEQRLAARVQYARPRLDELKLFL